MNDNELSLDDALAMIVTAASPPWIRENRKSPMEIAIERFKAEQAEVKINFDPVRDAAALIERCPEASRVALTELFYSTRSDLYAMAMGGGVREQDDIHEPSDIFATRLVGESIAEWRWTRFNVPSGRRLQLYAVSCGFDAHIDRTVQYDATSGRIRIDARHLPDDGKWRVLWLTFASHLDAATESEGVVFCVKREAIPQAAENDPAAAVLSGHLWHAWNLALAQRDHWSGETLLWLFGSLFTKMQIMIRDEILDADRKGDALGRVGVSTAPVRDAQFHPSIKYLRSSIRQQLDPLKQRFWDSFSSDQSQRRIS